MGGEGRIKSLIQKTQKFLIHSKAKALIPIHPTHSGPASGFWHVHEHIKYEFLRYKKPY